MRQQPKLGLPEREKRKRTFPRKALTCSLDCSQNKELREYQRRASWLHVGPSPPHSQRQRGMCAAERQVCNSQSQKARGQSRPQRLASSTRLWACSHLLTTSSWDPGWLTSARRGTAWDQLLRGDTKHTWVRALMAHPGNWVAGIREVIKMHGHLGQCTHQASVHLNCSNWKSAQNACPTESGPCGSPENLNLSGLYLGSAWNAGSTWYNAPAVQPGAWAV